jgi:hypothetical protein
VRVAPSRRRGAAARRALEWECELQEKAFMTDTFPDRLSVNPTSPYYDAAILERDVGIRFNGQDKTNVEEYCVSEGWIRVAVGKTVNRKGEPLTLVLKGEVEPYFRSAE